MKVKAKQISHYIFLSVVLIDCVFGIIIHKWFYMNLNTLSRKKD